MKQNFNEIKQNWNFYMCTVDEKAASIRLNFALTEIAPVEDYTHRLTIFIKMNNPTEDGLSSNEEYPILCDIEDEVVDRLETLEDIFAGTVKTQGRLELYLFTKNPEKSEELCKEALTKFPDYLWKTYIDEDKEWDFYYNFLYPDVYSYQTIMNRSVIENLLENEDKLEKEREIDHWLYTDDNIETFALAWMFGYTIKKDKRYRVKMKGLSERYSYLNYDSIDDEWYFTDAENGPVVGTHHTHKKFEDAGFGEVFNSPLFEVEEVE